MKKKLIKNPQKKLNYMYVYKCKKIKQINYLIKSKKKNIKLKQQKKTI